VDIKTGNILATIRKSVEEDIDYLADSLALPSTASQSRGTLMRGVLREMRVSMNAEPNSAPSVREEIETLRDRIKRKGEAASLLASPIAKPIERTPPTDRIAPPSLTEQNAPKTRGEFSGILAGNVPGRVPERAPAQVQRPPAAPIFRPSLVEDDDFSGGYQRPALQEEPQYQAQNQGRGWVEEEPDYIEDYQEPVYEPQPQHYHDRVDHSYPMVPQQPILSAQAEAATETAFRHLSETLLARATGDRGLEDMTREMLRGMIKQWLDANLPPLVEELVREEIERVARKGR
jgi:cell pole-organizing protein PopZ